MEEVDKLVVEFDWTVRFAIADAIAGGGELARLFAIQERLWRYDPDQVRVVYDQIVRQRSDLHPVSSHSYGYRKVRRRQEAIQKPQRIGLRVAEMADRASLSQATLTALLEHHGFLELVPYGGHQRRRLVSDNVVEAGYGHNVTPSNRIGHLEGFNTSATFPVFYEEKANDILWCLNYEGIVAKVSSMTSKKDRLQWLLENHPYLPQEELAGMSGYSERGVRKAVGKASTQLVAA